MLDSADRVFLFYVFIYVFIKIVVDSEVKNLTDIIFWFYTFINNIILTFQGRMHEYCFLIIQFTALFLLLCFSLDEIYTPVAILRSLRLLLVIAAMFNLTIAQYDVKNAFLNGILNEIVYLQIPKTLKIMANNRMKQPALLLNKALYSLQ